LTWEWISATSLHGTRTAPDAGTAENRDHFELFTWATLERKIVDLPAAAVLRVEQLMIEDVEPEVDRLGQF
jgi:hypothetical protein